MIIGILSIIFWLGIVPFGIGALISTVFSVKNSIILKNYLFGLIIYFSVFHVLIVTNMFTVNDFYQVCTQFICVTVLLAVAGVTAVIFKLVKAKKNKSVAMEQIMPSENGKQKVENIVLWLMFFSVLAFQLIQTVRLTFPDGDDAYYVGVATYGVNVPKMYSKIPYTGETTVFDSRHCLAPFPYVISFLARMSGISAVTIAHSVLPVCFILFAYGIHFLISKELCREKREVALFMLLISVLFLFGNYSVYSMETFLLTRTRQGKASLGSFALIIGFYLFILLAKNLEGKKRDRVLCYILLGCNGFVAALFTTMGNFIYPAMLVVAGLCVCFGKKRWKKLIPLAFCCVPSGIMAILYLLIR